MSKKAAKKMKDKKYDIMSNKSLFDSKKRSTVLAIGMSKPSEEI